jgi:Zn-dependent peptidase ImmA (M78 family)/transcriptional regulator with XRE-family HTH domain
MSKRKTEPVAGIQPAVMRWARQSIGLSVSDVALRLKKPVGEIESWETGSGCPSYPQLEKLAYQIYKRPLALFFLPEPPEETSPEREFRTLPMDDLLSLAVDTHLQIRQAHAFQLALRELFDSRNPSDRCIWRDLSLSLARPVAEQGISIRTYLGITLEEQIQWKDDDHAMKQWRKVIEDKGVFIFKESFKQEDISGFCLVDNEFPVVYLNNGTTKTRQIFSLLHELAHLLLNVNGLSKFDREYVDRLPGQEKKIERFCNVIAAEVLIPLSDFREQTKGFPADVRDASEAQFSALAGRYGVSRESVLRRFLDLERVSSAFYEEKSREWRLQQRKPGGGNWYATHNVYLSERFAKEVVSRHYRNQLSLEQAADMLGVKPRNFSGLEQRILQEATS